MKFENDNKGTGTVRYGDYLGSFARASARCVGWSEVQSGTYLKYFPRYRLIIIVRQINSVGSLCCPISNRPH